MCTLIKVYIIRNKIIWRSNFSNSILNFFVVANLFIFVTNFFFYKLLIKLFLNNIEIINKKKSKKVGVKKILRYKRIT